MTEARDGKVSKRVFLRTAGLGALTALLVPALGKRDPVHAQAAAGPSPAVPGLTVDDLKTSQPILGDLVKAGTLKVVGALYSLDTGKVEIIA